MINIYRSKYTKGVSAKDCCFSKGEKVWYRMRNGDEFFLRLIVMEKCKMENALVMNQFFQTTDVDILL